MDTLKEIRANPLEISSEMYTDSCSIIETDILSLPRLVEVSRFRENTHAKTSEEYFHRNILLPYLDNIITALEERFTSNPNYFFLMSILPPNEPTGIEEIQRFYDLNNLKSEVILWRKSISNRPTDKDLSSLLVSA